MTIGLTRLAYDCLIFIDHSLIQTGCAPSHSEIMDRVGFASKSSVTRILIQLEDKKYIRRRSRLSRAIEIIGPRSIGCRCDACLKKIYSRNLDIAKALRAPIPASLRNANLCGLKQSTFPSALCTQSDVSLGGDAPGMTHAVEGTSSGRRT